MEFAGLESPLTVPDRREEDWRKPSQASQKAPDFPLPGLEVQQNQSLDLRSSLPPELLALYGEPALLANKPSSNPDIQKDAEQASFPPQFDTSNFKYADSPVKLDQAGYATDLSYPGGKTRTIERDPQTHEATAITTTTAEGTTKLVNQGGRWYMAVQGMQLPFPGRVEVSKNGDVAMQTSQDGIWRIEKPDGSISEEKENADGARISYDTNHRLNKITRQDGTIFEQLDQNTIVESHPGMRPI
ncbi:MAG: hypothetical protein K2X27_00230, partial [Candidatus Obscuribacterales bacterium]|nr:hypothetical protein [Candidatus Obscuribacterales bacterium]